jgi:carbohydrate-selective porin OprB
MEVFYNLAITPWLQFSPSVQYIDSGLPRVKDSVVVTTRLQMYF